MFQTVENFEIQAFVVILTALWLGFLVKSFWSGGSSEPLFFRLVITISLVSVPLMATFPTGFHLTMWLPSAILLVGMGAIIGTVHEFLMSRMKNKDHAWLARYLSVSMAIAVVAGISLLSILFDFHWFKVLPLLLTYFVAFRAYKAGKNKYLEGSGELGHWWTGMVLASLMCSMSFIAAFSL